LLPNLGELWAISSLQNFNQIIGRLFIEKDSPNGKITLTLIDRLKWSGEVEASSKNFLGLVNKGRHESTATQLIDHKGSLLTLGKVCMLNIAKHFYEKLPWKSNVCSSTTHFTIFCLLCTRGQIKENVCILLQLIN
jgi:hypothetical protein